MSLEEPRELPLPTPRPLSRGGRMGGREAVVSILALALLWEALARLSPALGSPPFAVPSFVRIGQSLLTIASIDVLVTLARVVAALVVSFVFGLAGAVLMYGSHAVEHHLRPLIRLLMAV